MNEVVLVTGASSGIGQAIATMLAQSGYRVYGASRTKNSAWPDGVEHLPMDVTNEESVRQCMRIIEGECNALHAVINSAGLGMLGAIEDTSSDDIRELFETNLVGVHHVCKWSLPLLRKSKGTHIINITSMAAQMGLPYRGAYCASKFAVEGYTEALSHELAGEGLHAVILEPGDVSTSINTHRKVVSTVSDHHRDHHNRIHRQVNREVEMGINPREVAIAVTRILQSSRPRLRYRVAQPKAKLAYYLMRMMPDRWFEFIIRKHYKL